LFKRLTFDKFNKEGFMLDTFCNGLSDEAQLKIAIRFGKLALPIWNNYFARNPLEIDKVNALITEENQVNGGTKIDIEFVQRCLEKIERSYDAAKAESGNRPIAIMKRDATLSPLLATCLQPLQNKEWDQTLTQSVRLVFTLVFNILVWILYRRKTDKNETHIYVAINMGADALMRELMLSVERLNVILEEYKNEVRQKTETSDWENALPVGSTESLDREDIYRKMIGEKVNKNLCGERLAKEVLRQMRDEGKTYWNELDEYATGTSTTYSYDKEKVSFKRHEMDVIVGSFSNHTPMTESEMLLFIEQQALSDLRDSGFEV
jgi:hypothetical protein